MIADKIKEKSISKYKLAKLSDIPYSTLEDIVSGKTDLRKCSAETVYKLAKALDTTVEELLSPYLKKRCSFELFKSNVCHSLKRHGDIQFIINTLEEDRISEYYALKWYPECFYMLAMLDYISRINDVPLCTRYDNLRRYSLSEPLYAAGTHILCSAFDNNYAKLRAERNAIPEFKRFNIMECEVRDVV